MYRFVLLLVSLISPLFCVYAEHIPADSEFVQIEGRYAVVDDGVVWQGFSGIATRLKFSGAQLLMTAEASSDDVYIDVSVDGQPHQSFKIEKGLHELQLFSGEAGEHVIEVTKRTETWQGLLALHEFDCPNGTFLHVSALPEKKLMFIGDSITAGDAADIREGFPDVGGITHNGRITFGKVLSRMFNTQCHLVGYGGRGVIRDWQGNRHTNNAPVFYERALADDLNSIWDHQLYVPDVIGICLGQNDFSRGIPDQDEFVNAYVELLRKVIRDAPQSTIFLIDSPMMGFEGEGGVKRQALSFYLDEVVRLMGHCNVEHVYLGHYPGRPENAHPIASEHKAMAEALAPHFAKALGD